MRWVRSSFSGLKYQNSQTIYPCSREEVSTKYNARFFIQFKLIEKPWMQSIQFIQIQEMKTSNFHKQPWVKFPQLKHVSLINIRSVLKHKHHWNSWQSFQLFLKGDQIIWFAKIFVCLHKCSERLINRSSLQIWMLWSCCFNTRAFQRL